MKTNKKTLTIFTPTFNRKDCLVELYKSLLKQTSKDFLWMVVDDGSTDDTKTWFNSILKENTIDIVYYYQENKGKYVAHNIGVKLCNTELFVCVDSDETLIDSAVEDTLAYWTKFSDDKTIFGIISPKEMNGRSYFITPPLKCKMMDLYNKGYLVGESMLVGRASVFKKHLFPEIENEKFLSEIVVYNEIDQDYQIVTQDEFLMRSLYLEDGITKNIRWYYWKCPNCTLIMYKSIAAYQTNIKKAVSACGKYFAWKNELQLKDPQYECKIPLTVLLLGYIFHKRFSIRFKKEKKLYGEKK